MSIQFILIVFLVNCLAVKYFAYFLLLYTGQHICLNFRKPDHIVMQSRHVFTLFFLHSLSRILGTPTCRITDNYCRMLHPHLCGLCLQYGTSRLFSQSPHTQPGHSARAFSQGIQPGHSAKCLHPCQCILSPSNWSFLLCWKKHMDLCFLSQSMQKVNLIYKFIYYN